MKEKFPPGLYQPLLVAALLLCLFLSGCPGSAVNNRDLTRGDGADRRPPSNDSPAPRPADDGETKTDVPRVPEEKFYIDSDGNAVPDFIETEFGFNPTADDCPYRDCGQGRMGEDLSPRGQNTLLILDSSGSMAAQNKMTAAKQALERYVRTISGVQNLGFMVYGHRGGNDESGKPESCAGIELLAPLGEVRRENFPGMLARFKPTGWTPLAAALEKAKEAFGGRDGGDNRIILVSDGIETCGGDPVASAESLHEAGFRVRIDVIGFDVSRTDAEQLRKIAEITGGEYTDAKTGADLEAYLKKQLQSVYETRAAVACEIKNLMHVPLCNQRLVNKSLFYLDKLRQNAFQNQLRARQNGERTAADREEQSAAAYMDLIKRISAARDEREKKTREAAVRFQELDRKMNELGRQMRAAYGGK